MSEHTDYAELEHAGRKPKRLADHSARWAALQPLADVNGTSLERVERFAASKRITLTALEALNARVRIGNGARVELAFAGTNGRGQVVAIKYRPLDGSSHDSYAEQPSTWLRPIIAGNRDATDWLIAEGETDAARLLELAGGDVAAVMALPAGARTFRNEWAALIPRGATVALCHDADDEGDKGAERAGRIIGGRTVRLRPPVDGGDWCDWTGDRQAFAELVRAVGDGSAPWSSQAWSEFRDEANEDVRFLLRGLWPEAVLGFIAARPKAGKTWVALAKAVSIATGRPLFGEYEVVGGPRDVLYIALEGARAGIRARIGCIARGLGIDPDGDELERLHILYRPRPFNLADKKLAAYVIDEARNVDAAIVFVDVLRQASRGLKEAGAEDFATIRDALEPLQTEGRSAALLHHFGKLNETQKERTPGERMAGSGAMEGALDVGIYITKSEAGARRLRLEFEARDFATADPLGVALTGTGSGEHGGFTYVDRAEFLLDESAAEDRDLVAELEQLFADETWRTRKELAAKKTGIGANVDDIRDVLKEHPERFVQADPKLVGRGATAKPWGTVAMLEKVTQRVESPESPSGLFDPSPTGGAGDSPSGRVTESPAHRPGEGDSTQPSHHVPSTAERAT